METTHSRHTWLLLALVVVLAWTSVACVCTGHRIARRRPVATVPAPATAQSTVAPALVPTAYDPEGDEIEALLDGLFNTVEGSDALTDLP